MAADTISRTQPLSGNQKLVSKGGKFALGFFQPDPNRRPRLLEFTISDNGDLVLFNPSKSPIWSAGANITSNSSVAVILDTGNLVLRDGSDPSRVFWQSIDHPTDTWLPTGKIGLNKLTGVSQRLISWKNSDDPAPGIYSLELDPNGTSQYFIQWNKTLEYWSSGPWNGQIFSYVPEMTANYIYQFEYVSNATENYFTYSVKYDSITSRFIMDYSGQIQQYTWVEPSGWMLFWSQPRAQCEVYALCGPFSTCNQNSLPFCNCMKGFSEKYPSDWSLGDQSGGCVRNTQLNCGVQSSAKTEKDKFYLMNSVKLPDNLRSLQVGSADDCESACLNNCSCTAYSYDNGCSLWYGDLVNLQEQYNGTGGGTLYLRLAASELPSSKSHKGLLVGYSDLQRVTKNFSDKLGGGGFGSVYKGLLPDSTAIAVKKLHGIQQGEKQFRAEVSTIGTIQHVNLIRLLGFCSEGTGRLLVYEYMPKGSLDMQLFQSNSAILSWNTRYQIAIGTARGLAYLHEKCRDCIIHCDIKPENILLDSSFVPKVADFGLAKLMGRDFSRVLTTMRGTRGYLAPEWITGVAITAKADVYSYGMMLFEIISGRRNSEQGEGGQSGFFPSLAGKKLIEGDVQSLLDLKLNGDANIEELERACKVACWCIQDDESSRPTMGQVIQILEGFLELNMPPIPRSLRVLGESPDCINFFSDISSSQSSKTRSTTSTNSQVKSASGNEL
uniref:Receptor-like serine/threonine-protein kinase n=1 Tax=Ananas comosus var. bracteatus TaxID=296719 RepID=A0A6V7NLS1_ANACO|nr:unnamed protein product [Ananas comosus var. bracteatus]